MSWNHYYWCYPRVVRWRDYPRILNVAWANRTATFPQRSLGLLGHRRVWLKNYPWYPASRREKKKHFHLNFQMLRTLSSGTFPKTLASIYLFSSGLNQYDPLPRMANYYTNKSTKYRNSEVKRILILQFHVWILLS